jgi:hypothetical protein
MLTFPHQEDMVRAGAATAAAGLRALEEMRNMVVLRIGMEGSLLRE